MDILLRRIYSIYALIVFSIIFFILLPFFVVFIQREQWHKYGLFLNRIWARIFFILAFIPVRQERRFKPVHNRRYVFCPNHTSYLDIPLLGLIPHSIAFVGKSSIEKVPLFGYMYRKLHITVDRESLRSRYNTYVRAAEAIDKGKSLVMFPEGGIKTTNPPNIVKFKDGAFRIAIEKQIPVIPVTIPYNWIILPGHGRFLPKWHRMKVIYHEPIETAGMTIHDMDNLKEKVYMIIKNELKKHFPELIEDKEEIKNGNQSRNIG